MFTLTFWKDTAERAVATGAQSALGIIGADALDLLNVDWAGVGSAAGLGALFAVLKALVAVKLVDNTMSPASLVTDDTPGQHAADRGA